MTISIEIAPGCNGIMIIVVKRGKYNVPDPFLFL